MQPPVPQWTPPPPIPDHAIMAMPPPFQMSVGMIQRWSQTHPELVPPQVLVYIQQVRAAMAQTGMDANPQQVGTVDMHWAALTRPLTTPSPWESISAARLNVPTPLEQLQAQYHTIHTPMPHRQQAPSIADVSIASESQDPNTIEDLGNADWEQFNDWENY